MWKNSRISTMTKLRIFRSNVKLVLLYVSEAWKEMKTTTSKLQTFINRCLWRILNIHWLEVTSNEEFWRRTEKTEMTTRIKRRKWTWIGQTLRKGNEAIKREALDWNLQRKRRRGRPRHPWRRSVHNEALEKRKCWNEVKGMARNRTRWRCSVDALCLLRDNRNWWWCAFVWPCKAFSLPYDMDKNRSAKFHCFTVHFVSLSFIYTNVCTCF